MSEVVFLKGLPGCGKSTWAKHQEGYRIVNRDAIRHMLGAYDDFSDERESIVTEIKNASILALVRRGCNVIVDETHTSAKPVKQVVDLLQEFHSVFYAVRDFSDVPMTLCVDRVHQRHEDEDGILIPTDVFLRMHKAPTERPWTIEDVVAG